MTGGLKTASFYTVHCSDRVIMRTKGGASKEKIANSPKFAGMRKQQKEFGGCSKFELATRVAFGGLQRLADYNLSPVLNGLGKSIQKLDTDSEVGKRRIQLSKCKQVLDGFNFNRNYPFNTIVRVSPSFKIDRANLKATVTIPRINTDVDLLNIQRLPYFRLITSLGTVSDLRYNASLNAYEYVVDELRGIFVTHTGEWNSAQTILPEHSLTVQMDDCFAKLLTDEVSVVLCLAVEFGKVGFNSETVEVKYAGCGKVLCVR